MTVTSFDLEYLLGVKTNLSHTHKIDYEQSLTFLRDSREVIFTRARSLDYP